MKEKSKRSSILGFTLVELVIVIAVIAILAAVLIPTFVGVIDSANNSADLQLLTNMNTVLSTDIDADSTATAENLRKLLKDNGLDKIETRKSDNIIVYDQVQNKFKLVNLNKVEVVTEAEAKSSAAATPLSKTLATRLGETYLDETVTSDENRLIVAENPFSPDEIFKGYIVVSTGGNSFAKNLYDFHNTATPYNSMSGIWNSKIKNVEAIREALKKLIGVHDVLTSGTEASYPGTMAFVIKDTAGTQSVKKYKFYLTNSGYYNGLFTDSKFTSIEKIIISEDITELDLSVFNDFGAVVIIPNTIESVKISDETVDLGKILFVGNTEVLHEYAKDKIDPEIEGKETEQAVLLGAQVGEKTINEIKEAVTQFGTLIHETEFYLVDETASNVETSHKEAHADHYYTDIEKALEDVGNSAHYSGQQRDLIMTSDYTISKNIDIPSGVTLQIPYYFGPGLNSSPAGYFTSYGYGTTAGNGTTKKTNTTKPNFKAESTLVDDDLIGTTHYSIETTYKKYDLTLNNSCTITVQNGGSIVVGGVLSSDQKVGSDASKVMAGYQGHTSGYYGQITNNGTIVVENGGSIEVNGYIKGSGSVIAKAGSKVTEPLVLTDFHNLYDGIYFVAQGAAPFFGYAVLNIRNLTINCGATMYVRVASALGDTTNYEEDILIGYDLSEQDGGKTSDGLLIMTNESSSIILEYSYNASKNGQQKGAIADNTAVNLHGDIGVTKMTFNGTVDTGSVKIFDRVETKSALFPISYNFEYVIDGIFNVYNKFAVLPGAEITVTDKGTLNLTNNSEFYVLDYLEQGGLIGGTMVGSQYQQGCRYPTAELLTQSGYSASGVLTVNGTMKIGANAKVGGIVRSNVKEAMLNIDNGAIISTKLLIGGPTFSGCNTFTNTLTLRIMQDNKIVEAVAGKNYVSAEGSMTDNNVTVTYQFAKEDNTGDITISSTLLKDPTSQWLAENGGASWPCVAYKMMDGTNHIEVTSNPWIDVAE